MVVHSWGYKELGEKTVVFLDEATCSDGGCAPFEEQYREPQEEQQGECIWTMLPQAQNVSSERIGMIS